jgi:hypothetical protein
VQFDIYFLLLYQCNTYYFLTVHIWCLVVGLFALNKLSLHQKRVFSFISGNMGIIVRNDTLSFASYLLFLFSDWSIRVHDIALRWLISPIQQILADTNDHDLFGKLWHFKERSEQIIYFCVLLDPTIFPDCYMDAQSSINTHFSHLINMGVN